MRPVEFTQESIIEAGQALRAIGRNITGFALRQRVGGGSPNRLRQVWDEYQSSQAQTAAVPGAALPEEVTQAVVSVSKLLTERLMALAVELNAKAVKAADRRVHDVVHSAAEQRAQVERELADAAEAVDDLESRLDAMQAKAEGLEVERVERQAIEQAQTVELAQVRERLALHEQIAQVATKQHAAELERVKAERDTARREASCAREEGAKLAGQLEALQAQAASLVQALSLRQEAWQVEAVKSASTPPSTMSK